MSTILQEQYSSVFSNPDNTDIEDTTQHLPRVSTSFESFEFSEEDIIEAIDEIDTNASAPDNETPALVIKACKNSLSKAYFILWNESFSDGTISQRYKNQFIAPTYKKGSKLDPANYRPIP